MISKELVAGLLFSYFLSLVSGFLLTNPPQGVPSRSSHNGRGGGGPRRISSSLQQASRSFGGGDVDQAEEAFQSMANYHQGTWTGNARSFTVTPDVAAGIIHRKKSPEYKVSVRLTGGDDYAMTETFSWESQISPRSISFAQSNVDVDSVDASYSLDSTLPDFPKAIFGSEQLCQFGIEHCVAAQEDRRMRCFALYGMDQRLQRVVVCDETRDVAGAAGTTAGSTSTTSSDSFLRSTENAKELLASGFTPQDLLETQNDIDDLVSKLTGGKGANVTTENESSVSNLLTQRPLGSEAMSSSSSSSSEEQQQLSLHSSSLVELSSGVWLGDSVIRAPKSQQEAAEFRGFGKESSDSSSSSAAVDEPTFGDWVMGVQKVASRIMWNFGEEVRNVVDTGKGMGAELDTALCRSQSGSVCVDEGMSRRMEKEDRMVYIDWHYADMVAFLVGSTFVQVPRYINFDKNKDTTKSIEKPFFTEFGVYQEHEGSLEEEKTGVIIDEDGVALPTVPQLFFSKIARVYTPGGNLKQGSTAFYNFKRFGEEDEEANEH